MTNTIKYSHDTEILRHMAETLSNKLASTPTRHDYYNLRREYSTFTGWFYINEINNGRLYFAQLTDTEQNSIWDMFANYYAV